MNEYQDKTQESTRLGARATSIQTKSSSTTSYLVDNRPKAIAQRKLQEAPVQKKPNNTGLPDKLKEGVENLSGYSMDDVKVHYNSGKPAQLQALAYAQGTDIHVGPGQEKHLPHEAWHVVQQKQGRVQPTMQMKGSVAVNDESGLESEADVMGSKIILNKAQIKLSPATELNSVAGMPGVIQGYFIMEAHALWKDLDSGHVYDEVEWINDNSLIVNGHGEEFYLEYKNGKWERKQSMEPLNGEEANMEEMNASHTTPASAMLPSLYPSASSLPQKRISRRKQTNPIPVYQVNMAKIYEYLKQMKKVEPTSLKKRRADQRIELDTRESETLRSQLQDRKKKTRKQFIDPTYHETVQYINQEYGAFCADAEGFLNPQEMRIAYDMLMSEQRSTVQADSIAATGPSPLTTMTPDLLLEYQNLHYTPVLNVGNNTSSTREYEVQYTKEVLKRVDFSHWRPFALPEESSDREDHMINAIGGLLDVQTPTSGDTIGKGKVYSAIYKHFQRTMELFNTDLDKSFGKYSSSDPGAFKKRTILHSQMLNSYLLKGLYDNEEQNFDTGSGFSSWNELSKTIDSLVDLIAASLKNVPKNEKEDFKMHGVLDELKGSNFAVVKQFELIGTIIGLMIKKEKRQVLTYQMLNKHEQVINCLENLYRLSRIEIKINEQIPLSKHAFSSLSRQKNEYKNSKKELDDLK